MTCSIFRNHVLGAGTGNVWLWCKAKDSGGGKVSQHVLRSCAVLSQVLVVDQIGGWWRCADVTDYLALVKLPVQKFLLIIMYAKYSYVVVSSLSSENSTTSLLNPEKNEDARRGQTTTIQMKMLCWYQQELRGEEGKEWMSIPSVPAEGWRSRRWHATDSDTERIEAGTRGRGSIRNCIMPRLKLVMGSFGRNGWKLSVMETADTASEGCKADTNK